ncbi:Potassium Channel Subfamily T Member 1 [Manis pentadactyla]|nr:Potassium Channel Subfamily T Member 1 [Manis pentadactyla]
MPAVKGGREGVAGARRGRPQGGGGPRCARAESLERFWRIAILHAASGSLSRRATRGEGARYCSGRVKRRGAAPFPPRAKPRAGGGRVAGRLCAQGVPGAARTGERACPAAAENGSGCERIAAGLRRPRRGLAGSPRLPHVGGDARLGEGARAFSGLFVWCPARGAEVAVAVAVAAAALVVFQSPRLAL